VQDAGKEGREIGNENENKFKKTGSILSWLKLWWRKLWIFVE
jgi:hypothetical protein